MWLLRTSTNSTNWASCTPSQLNFLYMSRGHTLGRLTCFVAPDSIQRCHCNQWGLPCHPRRPVVVVVPAIAIQPLQCGVPYRCLMWSVESEGVLAGADSCRLGLESLDVSSRRILMTVAAPAERFWMMTSLGATFPYSYRCERTYTYFLFLCNNSAVQLVIWNTPFLIYNHLELVHVSLLALLLVRI